MGLEEHQRDAQGSLGITVITVSDTRDESSDRGGTFLVEALEGAGHQLRQRIIVRDDVDEIRAAVQSTCAEDPVDVVLLTGGTGIAQRDVTPEAIEPLFDVTIPGFGELFRSLSHGEIGPAAMLSRACAGVYAGRILVALPGSPKALRLAWDKLLAPELGHLCQQAASRRG